MKEAGTGRRAGTRSKSSLFLIELIIAILFFTLSSAICMKLFAQAKLKTEAGRELSTAAFTAESLAESYKAKGGSLSELSKSFGGRIDKDGRLLIFYDAERRETSSKNAVFAVSVSEREEERLKSADIKVKGRDGREIISLSSSVLLK